jgi:hypothetical protein
MSRGRWTEEEVERLRKLARAGLSLSQIGREMGRNVSSVWLKAQKRDIAIARDLSSIRRKKVLGRQIERS